MHLTAQVFFAFLFLFAVIGLTFDIARHDGMRKVTRKKLESQLEWHKRVVKSFEEWFEEKCRQKHYDRHGNDEYLWGMQHHAMHQRKVSELRALLG